jgi:predicted DsbA family dithiol-disulfide isomerase
MQAAAASELVIDVFADVACPWCYIGERHLATALATLRDQAPDTTVSVHWRPFQLRPDLPAGGEPWERFVHEKFGGWEQARRVFAHVTRTGAEAGATFDFEKIAGAFNTADAHRLILYAERHGRTWEMAGALFAAYFTHGRDISDRDTLVALAAEQELDADAVRAYLASDDGCREVDNSQRTAEQLGIQGVPFYVIDGRYGLRGAQPADIILRALRTAL